MKTEMKISLIAATALWVISSGHTQETLESVKVESGTALAAANDVMSGQVPGSQAVGSSSSRPAMEKPDCEMYSETACLLNSASNSRAIWVHYSNMAFCGLKILASNRNGVVLERNMGALARSIQVVVDDRSEGKRFVEKPIVEGSTLRFGVGPNTLFIAPVTLSTFNGESLEKAIRSALADDFNPNPIAVAVPIVCQR